MSWETVEPLSSTSSNLVFLVYSNIHIRASLSDLESLITKVHLQGKFFNKEVKAQIFAQLRSWQSTVPCLRAYVCVGVYIREAKNY